MKCFLVRSGKVLHGMQLFCVHVATEINPGLFIKTDGVYHQSIAFPMTYGVAKIGEVRILWMISAIHMDFTPDMTTTFKHYNDSISVLNYFCRIRSTHRAWATRRQTKAFWIIFDVVGLVIFPHGRGPWQHRRLITFFIARHTGSKIGDPWQVPNTIATEIDSTVSHSGRGC